MEFQLRINVPRTPALETLNARTEDWDTNANVPRTRCTAEKKDVWQEADADHRTQTLVSTSKIHVSKLHTQ